MLCVKNLLALIFLFSALISNSQPVAVSTIDSLSGVLISKIRAEKNEKLYVTTDKSVYTAGEAVWFRAFLLNSGSQQLTTQSQTVFVELVNEKNNVIHQLLLRAGQEQPNGRLFIPANLSTGYYWLRAYTKNMQLQETEDFAEQPVYVYNPANNATQKNIKTTNSMAADIPQVDFYPEGNIMITGAPSVVTLRIMDKNGYSISDSVIIRDSRDLVTTALLTNKYGLAKFEFEPLRHMKYIAYINWNGKKYNYPLPAFNFFAGQVAVSPQKDGSRKVRVLLEDSIYRSDYQTYLVAVSKDSLCFAGIGNGNYELTIPANKFPRGIASFFLFNQNMKLLSERSIYVKEGIELKAVMNKGIYSKREKADINISFADAAGLPVIASCAISVTENNFIKPLEDDAKYCSDWSLAEHNDLTDEDADLLMLTKNNVYANIIINAERKLSVVNDSLLYIHGTLKDKNDNPLARKVISLFTRSVNNFFETDTTDAHGRFSFRLTDYADSTLFTLQSLDHTGNPEGWKTELDTFKIHPFLTKSPHKRKLNMSPGDVAKYMDSSFFESRKILLPPVEIKKRIEDETTYDKSKRISSFSHILPGKDIQDGGNGTVGNALLRMPGLKMLNGFLVYGGPTGTDGADANSEPMIVLDGVNVQVSPDGNRSPVLTYLNSLDIHTIDFIELLTGPQASAFGMEGAMGVILVNTSNRNRQNNSFGQSNTLKTFYAKGYAEPPLFTMPVYDAKKKGATENTDLRSTVYWNGNIVTGKDGKVNITFYTNDVPGNYTVSIHAITAHGNVIYKTVTYRVK